MKKIVNIVNSKEKNIKKSLCFLASFHPADVSDFPFACCRFLSVSSRKYSVSILPIHEVAAPLFSYV